MNTIRVLFTMLLVSLTTQWNFSQEEGEDSDRLLATVNGVEIHESDVIGSLVGSAGIQQEQRAKYIEHALKQAIDNELLYQAGIKEGLDKDPTYLKQLEMQKRMAVHREVESLATFYEQNVEGLRAARDRDAITDEECEDYYAQNQTRYKGRSKDRALRIIRSQLANKRYRSFYAEFFIELVKETTCSVAGQSIDSDVLLESADRSLNMSETRPSDADPFWVAVLDAAGVDMPEPTTGPPGEIDEELKGTIGKITVKIGNDEVTLGDSHQIDSLVSSVQNGRLGSELFYLFKPYIVVQKAVQEGVDKDPAFLKEKEQMSAITGAGMGGGMGFDKRLLVNLVVQNQGFYKIENYEVTAEEVEAYSTEHGHRYERLRQRPKGEERVLKMITRILKSQKAETAKDDYITILRDSGDVQIHEE
ncbi:MAG: hypothetical protein QGF67_03155 [Lentisphaeria bacterium]|jgi:hypothetical protein|nr:hypothetical protein [Lentisphaeria bacterium]